MSALAKRQFAVIGGSSSTWGYTSWMQPHSLNQYDANAESLVNVFRNMGVCAVTGADELHNVTLADSVGHVREDAANRRIVFDAYHTWLTICTWELSMSLCDRLHTTMSTRKCHNADDSCARLRTSTTRATPASLHQHASRSLGLAHHVERAFAAYAYYCKTAPNETRTWDPPPLPQRDYNYEWVHSSQKCMYVHEDTGYTFDFVPPHTPHPWVPVYYDEDAHDLVCEDTFVGGPFQYRTRIPETLEGWCTAFDADSDSFIFYEQAEDNMVGYYKLLIPYLLSCKVFPQKAFLSRTDVKKAWPQEVFHKHPDKTRNEAYRI